MPIAQYNQIPLTAVPATGQPAFQKLYTKDSQLRKGSMVLVDFGKTDGAIAGVPANGSTVPNIAWETAAAILGAGDATTLALPVANTLTTTGGSAAQALAELTPKKGLHVIISQVNDATQNKNLTLTIPTAIRNYMLANATHQFRVSLWGKNTRLVTQNTSAKVFFHSLETAPATSNYLFLMEVAQSRPNSAESAYVGAVNFPANPNTLGNFYRSESTKNWTGTKPAANTQGILKFGSGGAYSGFEINKGESWCLYRWSIEDLTVSGVTFAEAEAADKALYDIEFASGGRFFGDTLTDPATLA